MKRLLLSVFLLVLPTVAWAAEGAKLTQFRRDDAAAAVATLVAFERTEEISRQRTFIELPSGSRGLLTWSLDPKTGQMTYRLQDEQLEDWVALTFFFGFQVPGLTAWFAQEEDSSPEDGDEVRFRIETSAGRSLDLWVPYVFQDNVAQARVLSARVKAEGFEAALRKYRTPFFVELLAALACSDRSLEEQWSLPVTLLTKVFREAGETSPACPAGLWKPTETSSFKLEDPRYGAFVSRFPSSRKAVPAEPTKEP